MAETIGVILLEAAGTGFSISGGLGTAGGISFAGFSAAATATAVGTAAIAAATIGLSYALRNTDVPKPENGSQAIKQAIPPRLMGYWDNRLAGSYLLFEAYGDTSYDVIAFHHGRVEEILQVYLHDDAVSTTPAATNGGAVVVDGTGDGWYGASRVAIEIKMGEATQTALGSMTVVGWESYCRADGIAVASLICGAPGDPSEYTTIFPHGKPELSLACRCTPLWNPRDPAQDEDDPSTWAASPNPVLQMLDYLTRADGGMGYDRATILPDDILDLWMVEADICDAIEPATGLPRYRSAGWFLFDNNPEDVVNKILSTCDGWMSEDGEGHFILTVGYYREPVEAPIGVGDIVGFTIDHGIADEQMVNQLDITFTNPSAKYVQAQTSPVRDEASISASRVRSQTLDLSWVQYEDQAVYLGERALLRLNPDKTGSIVTTLYGLRYLGKRWVKLRFPVVAGLEDVVIEIQSVAKNILGGRITFAFNTVNPEALAVLIQPTLDFSKPMDSQYLSILEDV